MSVTIHGKGRKQREVPLWKSTAQYLNKYLVDFPANMANDIFVNENGNKLTRSEVRARINKIVSLAVSQVHSLK